MGTVRQIVRDRRVRWLAAAGACGLALLGLAAWSTGFGPADAMAGWRELERWLIAHPVLLVMALAILPGLPVPSSALLVATGFVWRDHPVLACATAVGAFTLNMVWTYAFAAGPGRRLVERLLERAEVRLPDLPRHNHLRLILILRLTPGLPFFIQNYALGLLRPPFRLYLAVSVLCNAPVVCGLVLSGAGFATGSLLPLLAGISLMVLAVLATHALRRRLRLKRPA